MANELLWKLLKGETEPPDELEIEALRARLYTAGYVVMAFRMNWQRALLAQGPRADRLEKELLDAAKAVETSRIRGTAAHDGHGLFCVLMSYGYRREYSPEQAHRMAGRIRDTFQSLAEVAVEIGEGGFCACHEMIAFSYKEAMLDLCRKHASKSVKGVLQYVDAHFTQPELDNAQIAQACFLNYSYMCTHFHNEMGQTLTGYLRLYRLRWGVQYLGEAGTSIQSAAERVGYADAKYFAKCFKREFDMTPGEFQKRASRVL